jgi:hypothetical protein
METFSLLMDASALSCERARRGKGEGVLFQSERFCAQRRIAGVDKITSLPTRWLGSNHLLDFSLQLRCASCLWHPACRSWEAARGGRVREHHDFMHRGGSRGPWLLRWCVRKIRKIDRVFSTFVLLGALDGIAAAISPTLQQQRELGDCYYLVRA